MRCWVSKKGKKGADSSFKCRLQLIYVYERFGIGFESSLFMREVSSVGIGCISSPPVIICNLFFFNPETTPIPNSCIKKISDWMTDVYISKCFEHLYTLNESNVLLHYILARTTILYIKKKTKKNMVVNLRLLLTIYCWSYRGLEHGQLLRWVFNQGYARRHYHLDVNKCLA